MKHYSLLILLFYLLVHEFMSFKAFDLLFGLTLVLLPILLLFLKFFEILLDSLSP